MTSVSLPGSCLFRFFTSAIIYPSAVSSILLFFIALVMKIYWTFSDILLFKFTGSFHKPFCSLSMPRLHLKKNVLVYIIDRLFHMFFCDIVSILLEIVRGTQPSKMSLICVVRFFHIISKHVIGLQLLKMVPFLGIFLGKDSFLPCPLFRYYSPSWSFTQLLWQSVADGCGF